MNYTHVLYWRFPPNVVRPSSKYSKDLFEEERWYYVATHVLSECAATFRSVEAHRQYAMLRKTRLWITKKVLVFDTSLARSFHLHWLSFVFNLRHSSCTLKMTVFRNLVMTCSSMVNEAHTVSENWDWQGLVNHVFYSERSAISRQSGEYSMHLTSWRTTHQIRHIRFWKS